jgi:hypothetical protein
MPTIVNMLHSCINAVFQIEVLSGNEKFVDIGEQLPTIKHVQRRVIHEFEGKHLVLDCR